MITQPTVVANWNRLSQRVELASVRGGREPTSIKIMAVTKMQDRDIVDDALIAGATLLGENRVQEARGKYEHPALPDGVDLHLIGQLQTNKVRQAVALFDVIQSVDRMSLILALEREAEKTHRTLPVMIQVNVAGEQQKSGCDLEGVEDLVKAVEDANALRLTGLMTIAPLVDDPETVRPVFAGLRRVRDQLSDRYPALELSMGMTNDLDVAIGEGATIVRAGRALFGDRS